MAQLLLFKRWPTSTDRERWDEAVVTYRRLKSASLDPALRVSIAFRIATICRKRSDSLMTLERHYSRLLPMSPVICVPLRDSQPLSLSWIIGWQLD